MPKISDLPPVDPLQGGELTVVVQGGISKKAPVNLFTQSSAFTLAPATDLVLGGVRVTGGSGVTIDSTGVLSVVPGSYALPAAGTALGGVKRGGANTGITINTDGSLATADKAPSSYTASGAIALTDEVALISAAASVTMTLANNTLDGHPITIKRMGLGAVTLVTRIDNKQTSYLMSSTEGGEYLALVWASLPGTYARISPPLSNVVVTPPPTESASGTTLNSTSGTIVTSTGVLITLVGTAGVGSGLQVARSTGGAPPVTDTRTANITLYLYYLQQEYHQNAQLLWFLYNVGTDTYSQTSDPRSSVPVGGTGPAASSSFLTVDFTSLTGFPAPASLWGVATAALCDDHFNICDNPTFLTAAARIMPALLRLNTNAGFGGAGISETGFWTNDIFVAGVNSPNWNVTKKLTDNGYRFISPTCKFIISCTFEAYTDLQGVAHPARTLAEFNTMCVSMLNHFRNTNGLNGAPLAVYGFEIGNETEGRITGATYNSYFVSASDALHAVDPNLMILGPANSYIAGFPDGRMQSLIAAVGTRKTAFDYHGYRYGYDGTNLLTTAQVFQSSRSGDDATNMKNTLAGTSQATAEIFMGEWNIDYNAANEPNQQTVAGGAFAAFWMIQAFKARANVTMGGIWELVNDGTYGLIQGAAVDAQGLVLGKAGRQMGGNEVAQTFGSANAYCLPIIAGGHIGVMIVNFGATAISGTVALSHWPINTTGNGPINYWQINAANPQGLDTSLTVAAGVMPSITVPAYSVAVIHN